MMYSKYYDKWVKQRSDILRVLLPGQRETYGSNCYLRKQVPPSIKLELPSKSKSIPISLLSYKGEEKYESFKSKGHIFLLTSSNDSMYFYTNECKIYHILYLIVVVIFRPEFFSVPEILQLFISCLVENTRSDMKRFT